MITGAMVAVGVPTALTAASVCATNQIKLANSKIENNTATASNEDAVLTSNETTATVTPYAVTGDRLTVDWARTSFKNMKYSATTFTGNKQFENQYMYPSVWYMDWADKGRMFEKAVKTLILSGIQDEAPDTTWENIVNLTPTINDAAGTLTMHFYLSKFIDKSGNVHNTTPENPDDKDPTPLPTFDITIVDFKKVTGQTNLPVEYTLTDKDLGYNEVYEPRFADAARKIAIKSLTNSPINFELASNDKYITTSITPDTEHATVKVELMFLGYFDNSLNYDQYSTFVRTIVIKGYKSAFMTEINTKLKNVGNKNEIAQAYDNPEKIRDDIIIKNDLIINPAPTFNDLSDIEIDRISFNNKAGTISFDLSLNKFVDREGVEQVGGFVPVPMTITGFKQVLDETEFASPSYDIGLRDQTIYNYVKNPDLISNLVEPYLTNSVQQYTSSFSPTKITIKDGSIIGNSTDGKITFTPIIKNYFGGDQLQIQTGTKELPSVELTGFKSVGQTSINLAGNLELGSNNILPSDFFATNKEDLKYMVLDLTLYQVPGMLPSDINILPDSTFSNLDGTITLSISYNRWYSAEGQLMTTPSNPQTVTITGFRKIKPTTITENWIVNQSSVLASDVVANTDALKKIVLNSLINNIVPNTTIANIKLTELHHNNLDGTISFKVSLNKFFNSKGLIYDAKEFVQFKPTVTISGYRTIVPTSLPEITDWNVGIPDQLPGDVYTDTNYLKATVLKQLSGDLPIDFDYLKDIEILSPTFSNLEGTIRFQVNLKRYYDKTGNFSTTPWDPPYFATITNFKTVNATSINPSVKLPGVSQVSPSSLTKEQIIDLVYNNFNAVYNSIPIYNFQKSDIIISNDIVAHDNLGIIEVYISSKTYYNAAGELIVHSAVNPMPFQSVKLFGFSKITETVVNSGVSIPNQTEVLPTDLTNEQIIDLIYEYRSSLFVPLPTTFNRDSITILNRPGTTLSSVVKDNLTGTISMDLSINNYYNSFGVQEDKVPKEIHNFSIRGFKVTSQTYVDTTVTLRGVENVLASEVNNDRMLEVLKSNIDQFVRSRPDTFEITNANIVTNSLSNLMGTLIVQVTYTNYYDNNGVYTTTPKTINVRCYGFEKATPTIIGDSLYVPGKESLLPSSETQDSLKQIIWDNRETLIDNLPVGINPSEIEVQLNGDSFLNSQGQIDLTVKLYRYYNELANLIIGKPGDVSFVPLEHQVLLSGYNSITPTSIKENVIVNNPLLTNKIPTDITAEEVKQYIFNHREEIITSIPPGFTIDNIMVSDKLIAANDTGSIYAKVTLSLYYDNASQLQHTATFERTVVLYGFKKNQSVTFINPVLFLSSSVAADIIPQQVTYRQFVKYVVENNLINNPVNGFDPAHDIENPAPGTNPFVEINNLQGYITAKVSLNRYYDSHGNVAGPTVNSKPPYTQIVTIYGFKQTKPTYFIPYYESKIFQYKTPNKETEDSLLKVIRNSSSQFIKDTVVGFNPQRDVVKVTITDFDNIEGTVSAVVYLNNYYNDSGNIVNVGDDPTDPAKLEKLKPWNITFAGYKTQTPTSIVKTLSTTTFDSRNPSSLNNDEIADYLILNQSQVFKNLPESGIQKKDIKVSIISTNNLTGQILIDVKLYKYINSIGQEIIPSPGAPLDSVIPLSERILLKGFNQVAPTSTVEEISPIDLSASIGSMLPSDISNQEIADFIISQQTRIIVNNPVKLDSSNFTSANIISAIPSNLDGTLKIKYKLNNFYNSQGELVTDAKPIDALNCNITLTNLKKSQRTTAVPTFNVPLPGDKLPQFLYQDNAFLTNLIFTNKANIFNYAPVDLKQNEITITGANFSNLNGTITFFISLARFYDNGGNLVNATSDNGWTSQITLTGFNSIKPTIFTPIISLPGYESIVPTDFVSTNDIKKIMYENKNLIFSNLNVSNPLFKESSITINNVQPVNSEGKVLVNYAITNFYDKDGVLSQNQSANQVLEIQGFASRGTTTINTNVQENFRTIKPSEFIVSTPGLNKEQKITDYVYNNLDSFFTNLPTGKDQNNKADIIVTDVKINDKDGIIIFNLAVTNYYNDTGLLKTDAKLKKSVVLSGFAKQAPTYIGNSTTILNAVNNSTIYANIGNDYQTVNEFLSGSEIEQKQQILSLIRSSVMNTPSPNDPTKGIISFRNFYVDSENATITVTELRVTDFYDGTNGLLIQNKDGITFNMIISGFKKTATTKITSGNILIYVALGLACAFIVAVALYFVVHFLRRKYLKI